MTAPTKIGKTGWMVLPLAAAGQFMVILDAAVVNVALPSIGRDLGFTPTGLAWVVNGYLLTFAGFMLLGGRAADLFGHRRTLVAGLALFAASSLVAGLAHTAGLLVAARVVQGTGAAMMAPATLAVINTWFTDGPEKARAFGVWSAAGGVGGMAGAVVGGVITTGLSWRWIFLINVPIGAVLIAMAALSLGGTPARASGPVKGRPLVPLRLFRIRAVPVGNALLLLFGGIAIAMWYFTSLLLQNTLGFSALEAGLGQTPAAVVFVVVARLAAGLLPRTSFRTLVLAGAACFVAGFLWLTQADGYLSGVLGPMLLVAAGIGLTFPTLMAAATADVPPDDAGVAGGLANTAAQVGGVIGLAVFAAVAGTDADYDPVFLLAAGLAGAIALVSPLLRTADQPPAPLPPR